MDRLKDKVAVVTGASSGYGRSIARMFAAEGARVACLSRKADIVKGYEEDDDYLYPTHEDIVRHGGEAVFISCDVSDERSVEAAFAKVDEVFGRVDILVNNAGIWFSGVPLAEQTGEKLRQMLNVNVMGSFYCARAALKRMVAQGCGGRVIQMASTAAFRSTAFEADYDITKGAAIMLMKSITAEYSRYGITSNAICPAYGYTPMGRKLIDNPVYKSAIDSSVPLGRWVHPRDVAYYAVFLASDEAGHVTGTEAVIDGGQSACGNGHAKNMEGLLKSAGLDELYNTVH